jgi:hypothetical protein
MKKNMSLTSELEKLRKENEVDQREGSIARTLD